MSKAEKNNSISTIIIRATDYAIANHLQFITPEVLLLFALQDSHVRFALTLLSDFNHARFEKAEKELNDFVNTLEKKPADDGSLAQLSIQAITILTPAYGKDNKLDLKHFFLSLLHLDESWAAYYLRCILGNSSEDEFTNLMDTFGHQKEKPGMEDENECREFAPYILDDSGLEKLYNDEYEYDDDIEDYDIEDYDTTWHQLVTCVNDHLDDHNPLIGRQAELDRTIQVLCRKDKNNPLHVGEPGVGKTSLVYGLARRIIDGEVPERLKGAKIYSMDLGAMVAGTQYRGDFEKRLKQVMVGASKERNVIIYIDEIHNLIGAGKTNDSSLDASNILKPYLEQGNIRFIGSTTYAEYNRYMAKEKGITRRFQQIDISEPSISETIDIIKGLQKKYEQFHHVVYRPEAIEYAVKASAKFISDRFLPDKAIDLIDEAGAYLEMHPNNRKTQYVTKGLIQGILEKTCKIDAVALKEDGNENLQQLLPAISSKIYGQEEAVKQVVEAVEMAKAGLAEEDKPLASLLFVGPTGVGKTEVAKVLAQQLGIQLVRFDMSEYTEKEAVSKLIGSPAGYVGYEDGGQLTDAIRKTPNCVLLLDEIEKAHSEIYNIMLQVMDYARLTDNRGQKADFRGVILIMTSNAGAQYASQASVGFQGNVSRGSAMLAAVKKTFKPEFLNRLSATVVFRDMDKEMAKLILKKKLGQLNDKLSKKKVTLTLTQEAEELLLNTGFTHEYGARELDRVINNNVKTLLMREMLYGKLRKGGSITLDTEEGKITIKQVEGA